MGKLYVLCGVAGAGKSSWVTSHMNPQTDIRVSRDEIRFSMLEPDDDYFAKEKQVYREYITQINKAIAQGYNVFADATQINTASRKKLLRNIYSHPDAIECIWIKVPLLDALTHNEFRRGTRSYVPKSQVRRMYEQQTAPQLEEGFDTIYIVEPNQPIEIIKEG